jgi:hypothetical protein
MRLSVITLLLATAACGQLASSVNDAVQGRNHRVPGGGSVGGDGGGGGTGQATDPLQVVEAVIAGEHHVFDFRTGGVTPDRYTMIVAEDGTGPTIEISFDGNIPGDYACGAAAHTGVEYSADAMQATSSLSGSCTIHVAEVGDLGEPIRGTFTAHLSSAGGDTLDVSDGVFDVTNEIP